MLPTLSATMGIALILLALWDGFRTVVLPRRVTGRFRLNWVFYRIVWPQWARLVACTTARRRDRLLGVYSPLALLVQIAIWAGALIVGFALLQWSLGPNLEDPIGPADFGSTLYFSGVTFLTLGFGDVTPLTPLSRFLAVVESGIGFGFLAVVIGYLPMFYSAFAQREVTVTVLDARAGSPPSAVEFLRRCLQVSQTEELLASWEYWAAELLESHMSYPALGLFRSQHDHQSWLAALTTMLDTCALILVGLEGVSAHRARLTFAMARHVAVDLTQVYDINPAAHGPDRLAPQTLEQVRIVLAQAGLPMRKGPQAAARLAELRSMYEPYVAALSRFLVMPLPPWLPIEDRQDAWEASPYDDVHWTMIDERRE
ncbi:MAG: potassium channel family protein [Candidatus Promineifilaceae bacterium]|nr:potassium channel family protein [Candidatus Promineifilaceae bacterium]